MTDLIIKNGELGGRGEEDIKAYTGVSRAAPLADQIYESLLQDIVLQRLEDGQRLPSEALLCERFSVSRPVLRDALKRLKNKGLIVARQGSGSFVRRPKNISLQAGASMNVADIIRSLEFRMAVDGEAAYLAAKRRNKKDIENIEAAGKEFERILGANEIAVNCDFRFHLSIAIASHNDLFVSSLWKIHRTIGHELTLLNLTSQKSANRKQVVKDQHIGLWTSIRDGNSDLAAEIARKHVQIALDRIVGMTENR